MRAKKPVLGHLALPEATGNPLYIDVAQLATGRLLISAMSGGGKSWALRRVLEQTYGLLPHIVIDREGEFYTLREKYDYLLAGGSDADCPATPRSAPLLARRLLELRLSAVVDIEPLAPSERHLFVQRFLDALINAPKALRSGALVVIDECDQFAPENGKPASRDKVLELFGLGRKRGLIPVAVTRRLSSLSKDVAAECANRMIGLTTLDLDLRRARDELGIEKADAAAALRGLRPGEFWCYGPALCPHPRLVRVGEVTTTHPQPGVPAPPVPPPRDKVQAVLAELTDLPAKAEQEIADLGAAQQRVKQLERELAQALARPTGEPDPEVLRAARADSYHLGAEDVQRRARDIATKAKVVLHTAKAQLDDLGASLAEAGVVVGEFAGMKVVANPVLPEGLAVVRTKERSYPIKLRTGADERSELRFAYDAGPPVPGKKQPLSQRILDALGWLELAGVTPADRRQVGALAGARLDGGHGGNVLGRLRSESLVDYPVPGMVVLTDGGRVRANTPDARLTADDVQRALLAQLSGLHARILQALLDAHPRELSREELGQLVGAQLDGGHGGNVLGNLRNTWGVVEYPTQGRVRVAPWLFP